MWQSYDFPDTIVKTKIGRNNQINASEILSVGQFPVIDQGQAFVAGFTNEVSKVIRDYLPLIIFGDHTRCFKYIDFPFVLGADGTKVLKPNSDLFDPKFYYYALLNLDIQNRGYNRHFTILKEKKIPRPEPDEQRRIAHVLTTVQNAIAQQEQLITLTTELKRALMYKFFTEGLHSEKQKQTEIGLIPESWDVVKLGDIVNDTDQVDLRSEGERVIEYIDVSSISRDYLLVNSTVEYFLKEAPERARKKVITGDVIFATVRPTLLRVAFIDEKLNNQVCSTAFCVLRAKEDNSRRFIYYVVQREQFIKQLSAIESGASYPAVTDRQVKAQLIPLASTEERIRISKLLYTLDQKRLLHAQKKTLLVELFRTLLHQLMTAQIRVNDLELQED